VCGFVALSPWLDLAEGKEPPEPHMCPFITFIGLVCDWSTALFGSSESFGEMWGSQNSNPEPPSNARYSSEFGKSAAALALSAAYTCNHRSHRLSLVINSSSRPLPTTLI